MKTRTTLVPLLIFSLSIAGSKLVAAEAKIEGDLGRLQGRWTTHAGAKRKLIVTIEIEGTKALVQVNTPQGLKIKSEGEVRINESTTPRTIDWIGFTSLDSEVLPDIPAIYEFQGDALRLCSSGPNSARPKEFKKGEGIFSDVHVFDRVKLAAKDASTTAGPTLLTDTSRSNRSR